MLIPFFQDFPDNCRLIRLAKEKVKQKASHCKIKKTLWSYTNHDWNTQCRIRFLIVPRNKWMLQIKCKNIRRIYPQKMQWQNTLKEPRNVTLQDGQYFLMQIYESCLTHRKLIVKIPAGDLMQQTLSLVPCHHILVIDIFFLSRGEKLSAREENTHMQNEHTSASILTENLVPH